MVCHGDLSCWQGAGVEIYPGSVCSLIGNGIHHCKDGILIKVRQKQTTLETSLFGRTCHFCVHVKIKLYLSLDCPSPTVWSLEFINAF